MKTYLIEYDLRKQRNYEPLYEALTKLGAKRYLLSGWTLQHGNSSCVEIRDYVKKFIDGDDRLVVSEVVDWASYNAMTKVS